jgi:hypothetical protein
MFPSGENEDEVVGVIGGAFLEVLFVFGGSYGA